MAHRFVFKHWWLVFAILLAWPWTASADTKTNQLQQSGILRAGVRSDSIPFSYLNSRGQWAGYSVDILDLIRREFEQTLGRPIQMQLGEVKPNQQIEAIVSQQVDIVCGSTSYTWNREQYIDFSVSYFLTGTQLLTSANSALETPESLAGQRIGVIPGTTNAEVMALVQPQATLLTVPDRAAGLTALRRGEIAALASDGILLEGLRRALPDSQAFKVVPEVPFYLEAYACMVPENNSDFLDIVNLAITTLMYELISENEAYLPVIDRWFGPQGLTPISRDWLFQNLRNILAYRSQIPPRTLNLP